MPNLARPPLVEAVIEFRTAEPISDNDLGRIEAKYRKAQWSREDLLEIGVQFQAGEVTPVTKPAGTRFKSADGERIISTSSTSMAVSALPPYPGWDVFLGDVEDQYRPWRKIIGRRRLARIGVRYINRFDIPCAPGQRINIRDYMLFHSSEPDILNAPARAWSVQVNSGIVADKLDVNLNSASVESPILEHVSLSLDVDVFREGIDVPQADDDIWALLNLIRARRTEIFIACMTPKLLALIS